MTSSTGTTCGENIKAMVEDSNGMRNRNRSLKSMNDNHTKYNGTSHYLGIHRNHSSIGILPMKNEEQRKQFKECLPRCPFLSGNIKIPDLILQNNEQKVLIFLLLKIGTIPDIFGAF